MTLCPIAIVASGKQCPAFKVCPLKGVIGDYVKPEEAQSRQASAAKAEDVRSNRPLAHLQQQLWVARMY